MDEYKKNQKAIDTTLRYHPNDGKTAENFVFMDNFSSHWSASCVSKLDHL